MQVRLFGLIAEKADQKTLEVNALNSTELVDALQDLIPGLDSLSYALAVDHVIMNEPVEFKGDEEIALLPPFAGG